MIDEGVLIAGRYRLTVRLGTGAMGVVWLGQDERLHRTVAIKQLLLPPGLSDSEADEANRRAMREARITARLHHPHAIAVYDVAEHAGQPYLIMEYLPSRSLATVLSVQGVLRPGNVANIGSQIASALATAHQAGIVHRDIKPGNVLLADDGTAKITDFGISHAVGDVTVTATGILAGTPAYLAPEVAQGNSAGFPSDVFSLGATLYTALEGTPPFGLSDNAIAQLHRVASGEIIPPSQSGPLTPVLRRLLQRNPDQRPTMQQAQDALAALAAVGPGLEGGPPAATLSLSRTDPAVKPVPTTRQTLIQSAPPSDASAGRPQADGQGAGGSDGARPRRRGLLASSMAVVLLAGGVLLAVLISNGIGTGGNAASPPDNNLRSPSQSLPAPPTQPEQDSPTQVITPAVPSDSQDTPGRLQRAITDYYALVPGNLPVAWNRLTAQYQQNHAGGFSGYQAFWTPVQRVTVSDVATTPSGSVDATIGYFFKDGRVIEEQTRFGLVAEAGLWKIDSSAVRSSRAR
ncbi:MAG: protein kinase domain-containing protein [Pseudonocardiaceae bacterium]